MAYGMCLDAAPGKGWVAEDEGRRSKKGLRVPKGGRGRSSAVVDGELVGRSGAVSKDEIKAARFAGR